MRMMEAKKIEYRAVPCLKFGDVEMTEKEYRENMDQGKNWILCRTHAYQIRTILNKDRETVTVKYLKVPTKTRTNTKPYRYFMFSWDQIKDYIANDFKVWRVDFEKVETCLDEEYNARHDGDMNTYVMGRTLFVESDGMSDKMMPQWFGERALLQFEDQSEIMKMFHPVRRQFKILA